MSVSIDSFPKDLIVVLCVGIFLWTLDKMVADNQLSLSARLTESYIYWAWFRFLYLRVSDIFIVFLPFINNGCSLTPNPFKEPNTVCSTEPTRKATTYRFHRHFFRIFFLKFGIKLTPHILWASHLMWFSFYEAESHKMWNPQIWLFFIVLEKIWIIMWRDPVFYKIKKKSNYFLCASCCSTSIKCYPSIKSNMKLKLKNLPRKGSSKICNSTWRPIFSEKFQDNIIW